MRFFEETYANLILGNDYIKLWRLTVRTIFLNILHMQKLRQIAQMRKKIFWQLWRIEVRHITEYYVTDCTYIKSIFNPIRIYFWEAWLVSRHTSYHRHTSLLIEVESLLIKFHNQTQIFEWMKLNVILYYLWIVCCNFNGFTLQCSIKVK